MEATQFQVANVFSAVKRTFGVCFSMSLPLSRLLIICFLVFLFLMSDSLKAQILLTIDHPNPGTQIPNYIGVQGLEDAINYATMTPGITDACIRIYGSEYVLTSYIGISMNLTGIRNLTIESAYGPENCLIWGAPDMDNGLFGRVFYIFSQNQSEEQKVTIKGIHFRSDDKTNTIIRQNGQICSVELNNNVFDTFCRAYLVQGSEFLGSIGLTIANNTFIRHHISADPTVTNWKLIDINLRGSADILISNNQFDNAYLPLSLNCRNQNTTISNNKFYSPSVIFHAFADYDNQIEIQRTGTQYPDSDVIIENNYLENVMLRVSTVNTTIRGNTFWVTDTEPARVGAVDLDSWDNIEIPFTMQANIAENLFYGFYSQEQNTGCVNLDISMEGYPICLNLHNNSFLNVDKAMVITRRPDAPVLLPSISNNLFSCSEEPLVYHDLEGLDLLEPILVRYSLFENAYPNDSINFQIDLATCFHETPLITIDQNERTYSLLWTNGSKSPCINNGYPGENNELTDPDGTPPDIGCYYYPHHNQTYFDHPEPIDQTIFWLSFPVVDDRTYSDGHYWNELGYLFQDNIGVPPNSTLNHIQSSYDGDDLLMIYNNGNWAFSGYRVYQPIGYKVQFNSNMTIDPVVVNGFKTDASTTPAQLELSYTDEQGQIRRFYNYLGYYVPYTQKMGKAFSKLLPGSNREVYLDHIYSIKKQDGGTSRRSYAYGSQWIIDPDMFSLSEGEMVEVVLLPNAPEEMYWSCFSAPSAPITRQPATAFEYQEMLDYIPVFIEFDPADLPDEVGIYVNDICMGAAVVDSTLIEVNLYPLEAKDGSEIEIVFYSANKGKLIVKDWSVYNPASLVFEDTTLHADDIEDYAYLSFNRDSGESLSPLNTLLEQNHPNPFNPNTSISFVLSGDMPAILEIFNIRGQKITTLENTTLGKGRHTYLWNGVDDSGRNVSSGIYFSRLITPEGSFMQKMMLMK